MYSKVNDLLTKAYFSFIEISVPFFICFPCVQNEEISNILVEKFKLGTKIKLCKIQILVHSPNFDPPIYFPVIKATALVCLRL